MKPTIGRIVLYLDASKRPHPAIVLNLDTLVDEWSANLLVHFETEDRRVYAVPFGGPNGGPGTWAWPHRVEASS